MRILLIILIVIVGSCSRKPYQPFLHYLKNAEFLKNASYINGNYDKILYVSQKKELFYIKEYTAKGNYSQILFESEDNVSSVFLHKNDKIYYTHDRSGNGDYIMYEYDRNTKTSNLILGSKTTSITIVNFSDDNIFYLENAVKKQKQYFYKYNLKTQQKTLIKKPNANRDVAIFIELEDIIIESETLGDLKYKLYSYNIKSKKEKLLTPIAARYNFFSYDKKNKDIYLSSDFKSEFLDGYKLNIETGKITKLISENADIVKIGYSNNKKYWFYTIECFGKVITKIFTDQFQNIFIKAEDVNVISFDKNEEKILVNILSEIKPRQLSFIDLASKKYNNIDILENKKYLPSLIKPSLVKYKSRDGYNIYGYLFIPNITKPKGGYPLLIVAHGGPTSHFVPYTRLDYQNLLANGYAIFAPNFRGSTGQGKSFINLAKVNGVADHGKTPLFDVIDGKNYILQNYQQIDASRVGIMGGSYGGYMAIAGLAFLPNEFKTGVGISAFVDLVGVVNSPDAMRNSGIMGSYEQMGNPNTNSEDMYDRSPFLYADKIKSPLLMINGKNDWRFKGDVQLMQNVITKNGGYANLVIYDNEGHSLNRNIKTEYNYNKKILTFLKEFL